MVSPLIQPVIIQTSTATLELHRLSSLQERSGNLTYTITPSPDNAYISIKVTGDITRDSAMEHNIKANILGKKLGINKYLMDLTEARNTESIIDNYKFAYEDMTAPDIDPSARVAVLVSPDDNSHNFVMTAMMNAGLNVALFNDMESAKKFLRGE